MSAPYTSPFVVEATIQHQAMEIMNLKKERDQILAEADAVECENADLRKQLSACEKDRDSIAQQLAYSEQGKRNINEQLAAMTKERDENNRLHKAAVSECHKSFVREEKCRAEMKRRDTRGNKPRTSPQLGWDELRKQLAIANADAKTYAMLIDALKIEMDELKPMVEKVVEDRDTWRQKAIELGLEASQAEALLAQYRAALEGCVDQWGFVSAGYKNRINDVLAIPSPATALNAAIADELEKILMGAEVVEYLWSDMQNKIAELREVK